MGGPTSATLEREKALQVKEMPSEGRNLAEQRERHRARRGRACLPGKVPGRRRTRTHQASSPSQGNGREGHGHPWQRNGIGGSEGQEGPGMSGATGQDGRGREAAGVRYLGSQARKAGAGLGPGAAQRDSPGRETYLPWTLGGLFPDLVLEHLQEAGRANSPQPEIRLEPRLCSGPDKGPTLWGRLNDALDPSSRVWIPDSRQVLLWGNPLPHLPLGQPSPLRLPAAVLRILARSLQTTTPAETPPPAPTSRPSVPSDGHPPRGRLPTSARPGRTPPGPLYLGLSKLHPLRRSAALFCRRSAAAAPPGSGSIAPGGGRGLGRTRVGSGLGGARRAARLARRSPHPAPSASARPRPRPDSAPNFGPAAPCPSAGSRPRPGHALRLSPAHSVLLNQVQTPPNPAPNCGPAHSAPLNQVQTPPQLRPALQPRPSHTDLAGLPVWAVSTSARPTSLKCHPVLSSGQSTALPLPLRGPQHRPRPHPRTLPLLSARARPPPSPQGSAPRRVAPPHLSTSRPFLT